MKKIITLAILSVNTLLMYGQSDATIFGKNRSEVKTNPTNGLIRCVTDEYEEYQRNTKGKESITEFESWLAPKVKEIERQMSSNSTTNRRTVVRIPVVVHIIHSGQEVVNSGRNITDDRILSQISVLNQDFRRMVGTPGYNSNTVGADIEIEFCLAKVDPSGNPTTGINRVNLGTTVWNQANVQGILKPSTQWDPTQYFNIWVCQFGGDLNGVLGYAQFPQSSGLSGLSGPYTPETDGVIIDWRCFGSNDFAGAGGTYFSVYNKGRTATHEVGHALGLRHIWGDNSSCTVNATDSTQDYCPDTPAQNTEHYDCAVIYDTCTSNPGVDMTENYMDYSNDTCMNTFTLNQKARILAVMQNSPRRSTLTTSTACNDPLSVNDIVKENNGISIYPNPVKDVLNIQVKSGVKVTRLSVFNAVGQQVLQREVKSADDLKIYKENLGTGVFILTAYTDKDFKTFKFVVE